MNLEQSFKNIDRKLWKNVDNALDYMEQTSWIIFLKYIDDLEDEIKFKSELKNKKYEKLFKKDFQWKNWACKENARENLNGEDLIDFVQNKLFPYLSSFKNDKHEIGTLHYKIGEIFSEITNKITDGYILRDILDISNELRFKTEDEKFQFTNLYESKLKQMGNAGRNGGQYYTPRPLIDSIVDIIDPKPGETIIDPSAGSCGFLAKAYKNLINKKNLSTKEVDLIKKKSIFGIENKGLAFITGTMNLVLHGIDSPNLTKMNTLNTNTFNLNEKDRFDIILANPPFAGSETEQIQLNFPIKTSLTYLLFMQYFMKILKKKGRAGIIIKNTFLSNKDKAHVAIRKELLSNFNLHTILDLPANVFSVGVQTVALFFEKGQSTKSIWYYQLNLDRNLGITNPLNEKDLKEFLSLKDSRKDTKNSWIVNIDEISTKDFNLEAVNPNIEEEKIEDTKKVLEEINFYEEQNTGYEKELKIILNENRTKKTN